MKAGRKIRYSMAFLGLIILMAVLLAWNICAGSVNISVKEVTEVLFGEKTAQTASRIVWEIRLPRALAAAILGGALALAGYLLQTFFHNPIAGPFVLGISSGAKLVVALVMVFCLGHAFTVSSVTLILAAFIGACLSMGFVLLISNRIGNMSSLIIGGVMIGYICTAVTDFFATFADDEDIFAEERADIVQPEDIHQENATEVSNPSAEDNTEDNTLIQEDHEELSQSEPETTEKEQPVPVHTSRVAQMVTGVSEIAPEPHTGAISKVFVPGEDARVIRQDTDMDMLRDITEESVQEEHDRLEENGENVFDEQPTLQEEIASIPIPVPDLHLFLKKKLQMQSRKKSRIRRKKYSIL